eukprot:s342_g3.t1
MAWFAVLIQSCTDHPGGGRLVSGDLLGCENAAVQKEALDPLGTGSLHLCGDDPCSAVEEPSWIHVTRVRSWTLTGFEAEYLSAAGKARLKAARQKATRDAKAAASKEPPKTTRAPRRVPKAGAKTAATPKAKKKTVVEDGTISLLSDEEEAPADANPPGQPDRSKLRQILRTTRERIAGQRTKLRRGKVAGDLAGGTALSYSPSPPVDSRLVAGTALQPGKSTPLGLVPLGDTKGGEAKSLRRRLAKRTDPSALLLAQAVQQTERDAAVAKEKRKKEKKDGIERLADLLQGRKKKDKKKRRKRKDKRKRDEDDALSQKGIKPDPGGHRPAKGWPLAETADALASRFVAVHTALADGGWSTASQLEMYPLEPIQSASYAMHRGLTPRTRPLFPLPLSSGVQLTERALKLSLEQFCEPAGEDNVRIEVWTDLCILALNAAAGFGRAALPRGPSAVQAQAMTAINGSVRRMLPNEVTLNRSPQTVEKELSERFVTYTGEEVPKMQVLRIAQAVPALPPESHSGSIDARELVTEGTRWFLEHPEESRLGLVPEGVKLQAKVHVFPSEALELFTLLVQRRICSWISDDDVLEVQGQKILSGMFAVGKGAFLPDGREVQRIIMNLIPSNAVHRHAQGGTSDLPAITQYLSMVLNSDERMSFYQSDMTSAFYLFRIPSSWHSAMAFNIRFSGEQLGLEQGRYFRPCCTVIPMGWASAVSIMQEIAERLTSLSRLPPAHRVRRTAPLPEWLVDTCQVAGQSGRAVFHVYLDNFCALEKHDKRQPPCEGPCFHQALEDAWAKVGVLSSTKKRVVGEPSAQELGALFEGESGVLGPSPERLLRLIQSTMVVIAKPRLNRKWVQVLAGRWVHCMSFRRPTMVFLDKTWAFISQTGRSPDLEARVRSELFNCVCGALLMHTNLRAGLSKTTTASDASSTGGAVGQSTQLTVAGQEFAATDLRGLAEGKRLPILVVSLFNGIGCSFRCYDLAGIMPLAGISYELSKEGNRVTSRRWPWVRIEKDVRSLDLDAIKSWRYLFPGIEQIHVWGGFPCVGLSAVRHGRLNLDDPQSALFWELVRIIKSIRQVYGYSFPVKFAAENVSSMDVDAEQEISSTLGIKPWKLDSADAVTIHRPRFCWANVALQPMDGVQFVEKERWVEVRMDHQYPRLDQWIEEGADWPGFHEGHILPTCMKSIPRKAPPVRPAGLDRVDNDGKLRWQADQFRFPPYQYSNRFIFWVNGRWRLASSSERELLHGLGYGHTEIAWSASDIKRDPRGFEDVRKSLVGDGFNCFSFCFVAAMLCADLVETMPADHNFWPGQSTVQDRKRARRNIVLEDVGITSLTLERYYQAVARLAPHIQDVSSECELDEVISDWIQEEFEAGTPLHLVGDALSGLHHFEPFTRRKLHKSWRLYGIWRRFEVPCRAPPLTQDITLAMAGWCLANDELTMAALLLLGFHALLRTGEILQVRPCDFILDETRGLVSLPSSKSGVRNNSRESVSLHDTSTLETVRAMVTLKNQLGLHRVPCWDRSGTAFRNLFRKAIDQLEISALNFRPYSLRRGGATYEMQSHGLMEKTLIRGRWKNSNIARIYITDGLSLLPSLSMSLRSKYLVAKYSSMFINEHTAFSKSGGRRGKVHRK